MLTIEPHVVLKFLATVAVPVDVRQMADGLGADVTVAQLNPVLTGLVHHQQVKRLHSGDGILRYTLVGVESKPAATPAPGHPPVAAKPAAAPVQSTPPAAAKAPKPATVSLTFSKPLVLATLGGKAPKTMREIAQQLAMKLTVQQVQHALKSMVREGEIIKHGTLTNASYTQASGSPARVATPPPAKKAHVLREHKRDFLAAAEDAQRVLKALEFSRSTASDALDLYVASVVDADIYAALKRSANDAQAALDAYVAGGRA